jgi:hypothetical protein
MSSSELMKSIAEHLGMPLNTCGNCYYCVPDAEKLGHCENEALVRLLGEREVRLDMPSCVCWEEQHYEPGHHAEPVTAEVHGFPMDDISSLIYLPYTPGEPTQHPKTPDVICLGWDGEVGEKSRLLSKLVASGDFPPPGMGTDQLRSRLESIQRGATTPLFWDCECPKDFIKPKSKKICMKCRQIPEEAPDSRVKEVILWLLERINTDLNTIHVLTETHMVPILKNRLGG